MELFSPNKDLFFPNFKSRMEPRNTWRFSFIIEVVVGSCNTVFETHFILRQSSEWPIRIVKDEQYFEDHWSSLCMKMVWWGRCPVFYCYFDLFRPPAFIMNPDRWMSGQKGHLDSWVWFSTWTLFLSFDSRYNYILLIQIGHQSY